MGEWTRRWGHSGLALGPESVRVFLPSFESLGKRKLGQFGTEPLDIYFLLKPHKNMAREE